MNESIKLLLLTDISIIIIYMILKFIVIKYIIINEYIEGMIDALALLGISITLVLCVVGMMLGLNLINNLFMSN